MQTLHSQRPKTPHRVTAEFDGSELSFSLPLEATFADLAGRLAALGRPHRGAPISVEVRVGA
jgi:hypothetical protein